MSRRAAGAQLHQLLKDEHSCYNKTRLLVPQYLLLVTLTKRLQRVSIPPKKTVVCNMLFNSIQFVFFYAAVFFLHYLLPHRYRWVLLLTASCYFYIAFVPKYILILGFLIVADFFLAQFMEKAAGRERTMYFLISICCNIGLLGFFKYFNFFNENVAHLARVIHWNYSAETLSIIVPLGLSFHVFQSLAYVIEVYKRRYKAERHLGIYALYVMFFPQLVAGPIERPQHLLPQLKEEHRFDEPEILEGFTLMLVGFFKKLVIADGLALLVDQVFANLRAENGVVITIGIVAFAFQLYCDFSGYSDIALGAGAALGVELTQNFNRPHASKSIAEFWRRWHISLSSWLRDYLYYPLAYRLKGLGRSGPLLALLVSFVLIGLWHGAGWTYVAFGAVHGLYMVAGPLTKTFRERLVAMIRLNRLPRLRGLAQQFITFALVCVSWIFFRAGSIDDAKLIFLRLFVGWGQALNFRYLRTEVFTDEMLHLSKTKLAAIVLSIVAMEILQVYQSREPLYGSLKARPRWVRWGFYYALVMWVLVFGYFSKRYFVYFQF